MRKRHRRTLERIHRSPTPTDIRWEDIEALMWVLGVDVLERRGSRVLLRKGQARIVIHRPHPQPEVPRGAVRSIAAFLAQIGALP